MQNKHTFLRSNIAISGGSGTYSLE